MHLQHNFRLGYSTIIEIIREVCEVIWRNLETSLELPTTEKEWVIISENLKEMLTFPTALAQSMGNTLVIRPADSSSLYYNYKHYYSIVLLAVCDANCTFTYIDMGAYGKSTDSSIFKESALYEKVVRNSLYIPRPKQLSENGVIEVP
jgi:hypothetical protein